MALNKKIKVELPKSGIIRRKTGRPDVFKVLETFRKDGKPTNIRKCVGQYDEKSGMLIPNNAYYEFYEQSEMSVECVTAPEVLDKFDVSVLPFEYKISRPAAMWLVRVILQRLGVTEILDRVFGQHIANQIILVSVYMVSRGNVMEYTEDWCDNCVLGNARISSQFTSSLFAGIDFTSRMNFFKQWVKLRTNVEYIAYDVTSFSSYAKGIENLEWGYNRDKEKLPQINMALYLGQTSKLPVFYITYQGSIVDKSHLKYMMKFNEELGVESVGFVLDCGFCTTTNLEYMHQKKHRYIIAVEPRHKATKTAIEEFRSDIESLEYYIAKDVRGKSVNGVFYRVASTMHVYYDRSRRDLQDAQLIKTIENAEFELNQYIKGKIVLGKNLTKKYGKYFDVEYSENTPISFQRNFIKINNLAKTHGFFCLLSNSDLSSAEVLQVYRKKDSIEKAFDEIKNYIDMNRLRTHNSDTTDGKLFCSFIALIAAMHMQSELREFMKEHNFTKEKIIIELEKMTVVQLGNIKRQYSPLSKLQKGIINVFGLCEEDFSVFLKR